MREKPILFSAPMVRALLAGEKTQTRRAMKPQPPAECSIHYMLGNESWLPDAERSPLRHHWEAWGGPLFDSRPEGHLCGSHTVRCPYGAPGDRLWVKETHRFDIAYDTLKPTEMDSRAAVWYEADGAVIGGGVPGKTRVSLHMQRRFSRILLEIVSVRAERLQDCSRPDALAEGVREPSLGAWVDVGFGQIPRDACAPETAYAALWDLINGDGAWSANPWVWVVEFKRVEA